MTKVFFSGLVLSIVAGSAQADRANEVFIQRLHSADYYGFINMELTDDFDYEAYAGGSCDAVIDALRRTPSASGALIIGTYVYNGNNGASLVATVSEEKNDCETFYGFECNLNSNTHHDFVVVSPTMLVGIVEQPNGEQTFYNYDNIASGFVDYTHFYSQESVRLLNLDSSVLEGRKMVCIQE